MKDTLTFMLQRVGSRYSLGDKWLTYDTETKTYDIYQQEYRRRTKCILSTEDVNETIAIMLK